MQTDQLKKHLQLFTEGTPVPAEDLPVADAPAPVAGTDMASRLRAAVPNENGIKMVPLTAEEIKKFRDILKRMDAILVNYRDKNKKPFESVDFESMTENEQRQYIMQNLHLLSEADQMVVLRSLMSEDRVKVAGDIAKYGIEKIGIPAVKWLAGTGEKMIGGIFNRLVVPALQLGTIGGLSVYTWNHWSEIFPPNPAIDRMLSPEDKKEFDRLGEEAETQVLVALPQGYKYAYPEDLSNEIAAMQVRYKKLSDAAEELARSSRSTTKPEPGIIDRAGDYIKGLTK